MVFLRPDVDGLTIRTYTLEFVSEAQLSGMLALATEKVWSVPGVAAVQAGAPTVCT
jgi:hypothetical protein